jgi:hypothetical protein
MSRPTRTNPVYAKLAFRRAIVVHVASLLNSDFTSSMGSDEPEKVIHAEDVFPEDNPVPEDEIQDYVNELELEDEQLRLEMLKFNFVKHDDKTNQGKRQAKKTATRRKGTGKGNGAAKGK